MPEPTLRKAEERDIPAITAIIEEPGVKPWWGSYDTARVAEDIANGFVILLDGDVVGWLEYWEEDEPDYRHVSFDIALTGSVRGLGLGPQALLLAARLFAEQGHHRFTIDPAVENEPAIRAYEKVGFKPVGVMRSSNHRADGTWGDNLLMDLLAEEL